MNLEGIIFGNRYFDVVAIAWFAAQGYKVLVSSIKEKKINLKKLCEAGGMPSSHSSSVMALVTVVGVAKGLDSIEFAICAIFASVVMYDAAGVRRAAGTQAKVINKIAGNLEKDGHDILEENLKEILGHTPVEVLTGAILGLLIGILMSGYITGV